MGNNHYHDLIYDTDQFSLEEKIDILRYCKDASYDWSWETLNDEDTWSHSRVLNADFDSCLKVLTPDSFFAIVYRRGDDDKATRESDRHWCVEVGFTEGNQYMFIWLDEDSIPFLEDYFNIELMDCSQKLKETE